MPKIEIEKSIVSRAVQGDKEAMKAMFMPFLQEDDAIVSVEYLGKYGIFFTTKSFVCVTDKKVASIRRRLAETTRRRLGVAATVSAGAVISETGLPEVNDLIQRADEALYESKREGKDRITVEHLDLTGEPTGGHR